VPACIRRGDYGASSAGSRNQLQEVWRLTAVSQSRDSGAAIRAQRSGFEPTVPQAPRFPFFTRKRALCVLRAQSTWVTCT